ncbi:hypothetical protein B0H17DRAFT_1333589 [Mycena rosella]|uniref:F-box domain-containing protein n=1 Tax=Mycena rosella TaxID=1033263 RepID=A0AAD7GDT6_MYCRO|nr:hypothetical protein B0H17DRAFT_1333589 [Mycena rosella]
MSVSPTLLFGSPGLTNVENHVKVLIEAAESNIERLTAQIRELTLMRERERSILATLRLMVVPIGKLPTELLVEIFKHAVHTPLFSHIPISQYMYMPGSLFTRAAFGVSQKILGLAQVSPYWRQIVHSSPQLWAEGAIHVDLNKKRTSDETYLSGLQDFLIRSSQLPISVALSQDNALRSQPSISTSSSERARIMLSAASRWQNLSLIQVSFPHFRGLAPGTFNALECLNIRTRWHHTESVTMFQSSPRLRTLTLETRHDEPSDLALFQMPWSQLVDLQVNDNSIGGCRAILLQCSNLVSARFVTSHHWDFSPEASQAPVVVLPFLQTLIITFTGGSAQAIGGIAALFMPLALPSLQTLDLEFNPDEPHIWPTDVFSQFQNRSPNIEVIKLLYSVMDAPGLVALLRHAPALTTLDIRCSWNCVANDVFEGLRYDRDATLALAPKLQDVRFENVGDAFEEGLFEAAIRSRWWTDEQGLAGPSPPRVARLKSVSIICWDDREYFSDDLTTRMDNLVQQGLELDLY